MLIQAFQQNALGARRPAPLLARQRPQIVVAPSQASDRDCSGGWVSPSLSSW